MSSPGFIGLSCCKQRELGLSNKIKQKTFIQLLLIVYFFNWQFYKPYFLYSKAVVDSKVHHWLEIQPSRYILAKYKNFQMGENASEELGR